MRNRIGRFFIWLVFCRHWVLVSVHLVLKNDFMPYEAKTWVAFLLESLLPFPYQKPSVGIVC